MNNTIAHKYSTQLGIFFVLLIFCTFSSLHSEPLITDQLNSIYDISDLDHIDITRSRTNNPVHMLVVYTKFHDESPDIIEPPGWSSRIFDGQPGSINHYFDTLSFGQIQVSGEVLPFVIELPRKETYYNTGTYGDNYTLDALRKIDLNRVVSFAQFDNDGPDGIPGSGDDDGYVDYLVLMPLSVSYDFISEKASGLGLLPISTYSTNDQDADSRFIKLDAQSGCISSGALGERSIGVLIHEYIHSFDVPDLYDKINENEVDDSAGIGSWGIMGRGVLGWNQRGGPVAMSAYTRTLLGIAGIDNDKLRDIYGVHRNIRISDVSTPEGIIYRIWLNRTEYFLIEYRRSDGNYYDRNIPADGLLIWHINLRGYANNSFEERKLCDLEAADGKYLDAGFPIGKRANASTGFDNLDFYSKESWYANKYAGNLGDATDVYDGVKYTSFGPYTNPNTKTAVSDNHTGINIFNIRHDGNEMVFDVQTLPFVDWTKLRLPLIGTGYNRFNEIYIIDDIDTISSESKYLVTYENAKTINRPEELVVVGTSGIASFPLADSDEYSIQSLIEYSMWGKTNAPDAILARKNISIDEYASILASKGITSIASEDGRLPLHVQEVYTIESPKKYPTEIQLLQNYPNPFNNYTTISYVITTTQPITLEIYNMVGQRIKTFDLGIVQPGMHSIQVPSDGLSSGIYLYRISGHSYSETKRFVYLR